MAKTDPVTKEIISISSVDKGILKVHSPKNKWYCSKLFTDNDDAYDWRADFDLCAVLNDAVLTKDVKSGMARLVGKDWATEFMTPADLELWKADVEAAKPKPKTRAKPQQKAKQVPASDAKTSDSK